MESWKGKHFSVTDPKGVNTVIYEVYKTKKEYLKKYHLDYQIVQCQFIMQLWKKLVGNIRIRLNYL